MRWGIDHYNNKISTDTGQKKKEEEVTHWQKKKKKEMPVLKQTAH